MSLIYCEEHHHTYDSDYITYCDQCLTEELKNEKNQSINK